MELSDSFQKRKGVTRHWLVVARGSFGNEVDKVLAPDPATAMLESEFRADEFEFLDVYQIGSAPDLSARAKVQTIYEWVVA